MSEQRLFVRKNLKDIVQMPAITQIKGYLSKAHPWYLLNALLSGIEDPEINGFLSSFETCFKMPEIRKVAEHLSQATESKEKDGVENTIRGVVDFIGVNKFNVREICHLYVPVEAFWRGYSMNVGGVGYIIYGPGFEKSGYELIVHEVLHLCEKTFSTNSDLLESDFVNRSPDDAYGDKDILKGEYVVRALGLIYKEKILKADITKDVISEELEFPHIRKMKAEIEFQLKNTKTT
jgi:hypothetical protein